MKKEHDYIHLSIPTPVTEQVWPEGTLPIVAVNVNTYNHCQFIRDCIEGIIMQKTTFPVRVLIFDDCSTDGTREIVQEYEAKYPHLITGFYPKENTFRKPNRSEALKPRKIIRDTALYIAKCEGDDYWIDSLKLQKQIEVLENDPDCSLCFHPTKFVRNNNPLDSYIHAPSIKRDKYTMIDVIRGGGGFMATNSMVYRTEYLKNNYPDWARKAPVGDLPLMLVLASKGHFRYVDDVMGVYRIMSSDSAWSAKMKDWKNRKKHHYQILDMWDEFDKWSEFKFHKYVVEKKRNNTINFYKGAIHHFLKKFL